MEFTDEQIKSEFTKYSEKVSEDDVSDVLGKKSEILGKATGPLEKFVGDMSNLFSMIKDYASGDYSELPWTIIAAVVGSLIYVFSPIDLIPDVLPVFGLLDDAAVVALCLKSITIDLEKYLRWKRDADKGGLVRYEEPLKISAGEPDYTSAPAKLQGTLLKEKEADKETADSKGAKLQGTLAKK